MSRSGLLESLVEAKVEFVLVDGLAVALQRSKDLVDDEELRKIQALK